MAGQQQFILLLAEDNATDAQLQLSGSSQRVVLALRCRAREKNKLPGTRQETKRNTLKKCLPSIHFYGFLLTSKLSSVPPLIQKYCSSSSPVAAASSTVDKNWLQDVEEDWVICYSETLVCLYGLLVEAITKKNNNSVIPVEGHPKMSSSWVSRPQRTPCPTHQRTNEIITGRGGVSDLALQGKRTKRNERKVPSIASFVCSSAAIKRKSLLWLALAIHSSWHSDSFIPAHNRFPKL